MITWKDFVLDDFLGPVLSSTPDVWAIMEDERTANEALGKASIQETRQGQRPARMVGSSGLDAVRLGKDADRTSQGTAQRKGAG